jgi:hypothetical protein
MPACLPALSADAMYIRGARGRGLFPSLLLPFSLTHLLCSSERVMTFARAYRQPDNVDTIEVMRVMSST